MILSTKALNYKSNNTTRQPTEILVEATHSNVEGMCKEAQTLASCNTKI